ncbi:MAG: hypothetical protein PHO63_01035 [Bacilli bacterium]|nr:hypothetical protein [Bacilli bacterium]MDD4808520.1 hypothetical protein [Bacilli bacterium]
MKGRDLLILIIILLILIIPIRLKYKDGGTVEYKAVLYKVIKWNRMIEFGEYKTGTEVILFPNNFHPIDYYDDVRPLRIAVYNENKKDEYVIGNTGSYTWSKEVDGKWLHVTADAIDPVSMDYEKVLEVLSNSKIYTMNLSNVTKIYLYEGHKTAWYEGLMPLSYKVIFDESDGSLLLPNITSGDYIVQIDIEDGDNTAWYSFKISVKEKN